MTALGLPHVFAPAVDSAGVRGDRGEEDVLGMNQVAGGGGDDQSGVRGAGGGMGWDDEQVDPVVAADPVSRLTGWLVK